MNQHAHDDVIGYPTEPESAMGCASADRDQGCRYLVVDSHEDTCVLPSEQIKSDHISEVTGK